MGRNRFPCPVIASEPTHLCQEAVKPWRSVKTGTSLCVSILKAGCSDQLVPSANMALHRAHCERNISRCSACKAPIQISDMEAHRAAHAARTRLFGACEQIDLDLARDCLEHGADCNASNEAGNTLLHIAARMGSPDLIQLLIGAKATLAQNNLHDTPLDVAYKVNSNAVIIKLLQQVHAGAIVSPM